MKRLTVIGLFLLLFVVACTPSQKPVSLPPEPGSVVHDVEGNIVELTKDGFSPSELTIKAGQTVTWINKNTEEHWPASAMHPTHKVYPGSGIEKCGTGEAIFDACGALAPGESFSFTFNEVGTWSYHDHLNVHAPFFGKIIVE
jgi:plastocyanin